LNGACIGITDISPFISGALADDPLMNLELFF
jgi:hypothetical protein